LFGAGYFRHGEGALPGLLCLQYHLFLAAMGAVLLADDAYSFMVSWESMALTSYFLVTTQHRIPEIRRAGFLYLLIAHLGAIGILLSFGVMQGGSWQFSFDAMRAAELPPAWASAGFLLALAGFGAKAGLVPLHVWLPEAHPAAPSPVSALMSGVMLKTAVYGVLRVSFDLLGSPAWWWGLVAMALGLFSALYGIVFAAVQTDMKRLLAFSSIENIGLLFTGLGLALVFYAAGMNAPAGLALIARHGRRAARDGPAQPRQARRPDSPHALGRVDDAHRGTRDRRTAAAERLRLRMAAAASLPVRT
jgi:formate hydrogenlyase subunit 3/multisubunit Na+/H+ antiporter MnhD subunit